METQVLRAAGQSEVTIYHFGAHVTSWKNSQGREMIYTSPTAVYTGEKAIRGGIPICFPQFGKKGPLRQHGFARINTWQLDDTYTPPTSDPSVRFTLTDNEQTRASEWPFAFKLGLTVTLAADGNSVTVDMDVTNLETENGFSFTTALHSYFTCEATATIVTDLDGVEYVDTCNLLNGTEAVKQQGDVTFMEKVDRIYFDTPSKIFIPNSGLTIEKKNLPEAVVWNPSAEGAAELSDMPNDGWKYYICIEPARVAAPAEVDPGQTWTCTLKMTST